MRIVSFGPKGQEKPGAVLGDRVFDLTAADPSLPSTVRRILEEGALSRVGKVLSSKSSLSAGLSVPLARARLGPPVTDPSKIICLGLNYPDHAREQGKEIPDWPLLFSKAPSSLIGDRDPIPLPAGVIMLDYEVELAFVIGRRAKAVSLEGAPQYIAGYSVFLDITARDIQFREKQWFRSKSFDGFGPFGPYLTTPEDIPNPHNLMISLELNGETVQSSNTGLMRFQIPYLVHYLSHSMTLEAGDIITTGTPAGVGVFATPQRFLKRGDSLKATVESLGTLTNTVT